MISTLPIDDIERYLVELWGKLLNIKGISVTDNFFNMGGDSVLALDLFSHIEKNFGKKLPLNTLTKSPTIRELACHLRDADKKDTWRSAIALKSEGTKPPLYVVPGAGMDVIVFRELIEHWRGEHPFYGLQFRGVDGVSPVHTSIEDMAAYFVDDMLKVQPNGPYYIGGTSFGGTVAYEMAQQLIAQDRDIAMLALLDSFGPGYPARRRDVSLRQKCITCLQSLQPAGARDKPPTLVGIRDGIIQKLDVMRSRMLVRYYKQRDMTIPGALRFFYLLDACYRARLKYTYQPYPGKITLFRAMSRPSPELFVDDPYNGWGSLAQAGIDVVDVPGYHNTRLKGDNARVHAERLVAYMDGAEKET